MVAGIEDLHADVLACALRRLDGRSLAAASCATTGLRATAADPETWRALCLSEWPSLATQPRLLSAVLPRRFFADVFPYPSSDAAAASDGGELPRELISSVDVYYRGASLLARAVETSTLSAWFLTSPFRVDAVEGKNPAPVGFVSPAELELSWIVVDPDSGRAVNVSSRRAVAVDRQWYTGDTLVRYAVVLGMCKFEATVTFSEETGSVTGVRLSAEDADGATVSGERGLRLLAAAMERPRKGGEKEGEEAKRRYEEFVKRKRGMEELKARREALADLCCFVVSSAAVLAFLAAVVLR